MKNRSLKTLAILVAATSISCSQNNTTVEKETLVKQTVELEPVRKTYHNYGGWYCPDNLNGFPAVDLNNWQNVPVINGRMATKEETQNGNSLIFIDSKEYPDARPLDMTMPKLARYYNGNSKKEELIIVIQAVSILKDSIVGFRYLNGGNGSARLNEVRFLSVDEISNLSPARFVSQTISINATQADIWEVLTNSEYSKVLQSSADKQKTFVTDANKSSKVNFHYSNKGKITSEYADMLFGNQYIQIDYGLGDYQYVQKFLLLENEKTKKTELKIVCGPYGDDFEKQQTVLKNWALKVKELSED